LGKIGKRFLIIIYCDNYSKVIIIYCDNYSKVICSPQYKNEGIMACFIVDISLINMNIT